MPTVAIDRVEAGMVLAEPAKDSRGNVLVGPGVALTDALRQRLRDRGVKSVTVEGDGGAEAADNTQQVKALEQMFSRWDSDELMCALREAARPIVARRKSG